MSYRATDYWEEWLPRGRCPECEVTLPDLLDGAIWRRNVCPPCAGVAGHATFKPEEQNLRGESPI